ncbi:MAG: UvrB/UvrC motif-containing protein, partial [Flavobacteriales bacterium]
SRQLKYTQETQAQLAAEPVQTYANPKELEARMKATKKAMEKAAKELDFMEAARYRDQLKELEKQQKK